MDEITVMAADGVFPVAGPAVARGAVAVGGGVVMAVGREEEVRGKFPGAKVEEMRGCVLLPGLVNAHCHLELGYLRGKLPGGAFVDWVIELMGAVNGQADLAATVAKSVREGMAELLTAGVTGVGDICKQVQMARPGLARGPVRVVSFGEVQALGQRRGLLGERLAAARDRKFVSETMCVGLSPHSPYTVEGPSLRAILEAAREDRLPVCMHLAELREEAVFLETLGGEIRRAWEAVGIAEKLLDENVPRFVGGAIRWAREFELLEPHAERESIVPTAWKPWAWGAPLLAHVNYADDEELEIIARSGASVAYCPRTRAFFGHDAVTPHRFEEMLRRGINVCLATDSLASNPDLLLMREAQFVLRVHPEISPAVLLEMITVNGARALGGLAGAGTIVAGGVADMAAFAIPGGAGEGMMEVLHAVLAEAPNATAVWIGGRRVN